MMGVLKLVALLLILTTKSLFAEVIQIKTGDHGSFTRVVFYLSNSQEWEVNQVGREINITFPEYSGEIDDSSFFARISNRVISGTLVRNNEINLGLACDCIFTLGPTAQEFRYIDIALDDQNFNYFNISDTIVSSAKNVTPAYSHIEDERSNIDAATDTANEVTATEFILPLTDQNFSTSNFPEKNRVNTELTTTDPENGIPSNLVEQTGQSLGRIMTKGILNSLDNYTTNNQINENFPNLQLIDSRNLRVTDPNSSNSTSQLDKDEPQCGKYQDFSISDWKFTGDFSYETSRLRSAMFSEFDDLNTDTLIELSKVYVYHSFGLEARQILNLQGGDELEVALIKEISLIVDGDFHISAPKLSSMLHCGNFFALLNLLIQNLTVEDSDINTNNALVSFNSLPSHLRSIFAPRLSQVLLNEGEISEANFAIRATRRGFSENESEIDAASAAIKLATNELKDAHSLLFDVIDDNSNHSARSAIELVKSLTDQRNQVPSQILDLLSAYVVEYRGQENEAELSQSLALALSSNNEHPLAFQEILNTMGQFNISTIDENLLEKMVYYLVNDPNDGSFLSSVFSIFPNTQLSLKNDTWSTLHGRLSDLGFESSTTYLWPMRVKLSSSPSTEGTPYLSNPESQNEDIAIRSGEESSVLLQDQANQSFRSSAELILSEEPSVTEALNLISQSKDARRLVTDVIF